MKTFAFDFYNKQSAIDMKVLVFGSRKEAANQGNSWTLAANEDELAATNVSMSQMVELYNTMNPDSPIKAFRDRPTAIKRMIALAQAKATKIETPADVAETQESEVVKKTKKEKVIKKESGKRGRTSVFAGKTIKPSADVKENPRREGTISARGMEIILANRRGIKYEAYIEQGGRRQDLAWDIAHGYAYVE